MMEAVGTRHKYKAWETWSLRISYILKHVWNACMHRQQQASGPLLPETRVLLSGYKVKAELTLVAVFQ